jgi:hypothetical protein
MMIQREELARNVKGSLQKANSRWRHLKRLYTLFLIVSLVTSAVATLLAGGTAFKGKSVIDYYDGDNKKNWTLICAIAAILTFISSLCVGIKQVLGDAKRVDAAKSCVGRLKALDILINNDERSVNDILEDYAKITEDHPELTV